MANPKSDDPAGKSRGDNRTNSDRDGNRGPARQPGAPAADGDGRGDEGSIPSVGQNDEDPANRDRGDGTRRGGVGKRPEPR